MLRVAAQLRAIRAIARKRDEQFSTDGNLIGLNRAQTVQARCVRRWE